MNVGALFAQSLLYFFFYSDNSCIVLLYFWIVGIEKKLLLQQQHFSCEDTSSDWRCLVSYLELCQLSKNKKYIYKYIKLVMGDNYYFDSLRFHLIFFFFFTQYRWYRVRIPRTCVGSVGYFKYLAEIEPQVKESMRNKCSRPMEGLMIYYVDSQLIYLSVCLSQQFPNTISLIVSKTQ